MKVWICLDDQAVMEKPGRVTLDKVSKSFSDGKFDSSRVTLGANELSTGERGITKLDVLKAVDKVYPGADITMLGSETCWIEIKRPEKSNVLKSVLCAIAVLIVFFGSAFAVMNYHEDVNMKGVHQNITRMVTGDENASPLLVAIPYSIGTALGALLFMLPKSEKEPNPIEVQSMTYEQDVQKYKRAEGSVRK